MAPKSYFEGETAHKNELFLLYLYRYCYEHFFPFFNTIVMVGRVATEKIIDTVIQHYCAFAYDVNGVEEYFVPTEVPCIIKHCKK